MSTTSKLGIREYVFCWHTLCDSGFHVHVCLCALAIRQALRCVMILRKCEISLPSSEVFLIGAMINIKKDIAALEKAVTYLDNRVPQSPGTEKTIDDLSRLARKNGLRTKKIRALTPVMPITTELKLGAVVENKKKNEYEYREMMVELEGGFKKFLFLPAGY